ncbi:MAG: twin-arginine translocase subunit TatC [Spirochaetales bacterium]|nr:twin-arginine translocase subunit TatC [Spirochaetales bacterium]
MRKSGTLETPRSDPRLRRKPEDRGFLEHFRELRRRLIASVVAVAAAAGVAFGFYDRIIALLYAPFQSEQFQTDGEFLFIHTIFEGFLVKLKVSLLAGLILAFPFLLYNLLRFVFPGLKSREKRIVSAALVASFVLIGVSFYYGYYQVIPISIAFLTGSGFIPAGTGLLLNFGRNVFVIFQLLFITILLFQFPVVLEVLLVMNVVSRRALLKAGRYVVTGIFVVSAILTPPDFVSQLSVAVPLVGLYFLAILIARIGGFGKGVEE